MYVDHRPGLVPRPNPRHQTKHSFGVMEFVHVLPTLIRVDPRWAGQPQGQARQPQSWHGAYACIGLGTQQPFFLPPS